MKFKNGLLIVLLIIGLISIASVSASEIDDATISLEDDVNIAVDDDSNQIVDLEDSLSESSQETIKEESLSELSQETTNEETLSESSQEAIKEENKEILAASEEAAQEDDGSRAEGAGSAVGLGKVVEDKTGIDTRVSVLGHIQRGGSPTIEDRIKASMLGEKAALAIISGATKRVFN